MDTKKTDVQALKTALEQIATRLDGLQERVHKDPDFADQWELVTPNDGGNPYRRGTPEVGTLLHKMGWSASLLREAAASIV